jgi:hypothetical protein
VPNNATSSSSNPFASWYAAKRKEFLGEQPTTSTDSKEVVKENVKEEEEFNEINL